MNRRKHRCSVAVRSLFLVLLLAATERGILAQAPPLPPLPDDLRKEELFNRLEHAKKAHDIIKEKGGVPSRAETRRSSGPRRGGGRTNVVLLFSDDLGYGDLGIHGSSTIPTPHIDALARDGVRFTDAYVTAGTCSPSRAALMSGRYQQRWGFEFNTGPAAITESEKRGLDPAAVTIADVLKGAGYATGLVGKWHLGTRDVFHPRQRGFDEFFGFLPGAHSYLPESRDRPDYATILRGRDRVDEKEYLTDAFAREAVDFIDRHRSEPFFLYVSFNAVHTPIEATRKYLDRFPGVADRKQRTYDAMVSALDDAVGRIVSALEERNLEKNTLVIFLNDNGGPIYTGVQSNGPLRLGKLFLFEGGVRVPMILRWPGVLDAGTIHRDAVSALDLFPTICAAAGVEAPAKLELDGVDLFPYVKGEKSGPTHEHLFWRNGTNRAIRGGSWKMVKAGDHVWLFDLSRDIGETNNVAPEHPEVVERLEKALKKWESTLPPPAWPSRRARRDVVVDGITYEIHI